MRQWRQAETGLQKFRRVPTSVPVRISTVDAEIDPSTGRAFFRSAEETTANLSRGGAYVKSWEPLAAGRRVVLAIVLPGEEELQLVGRVVWTRRALRPPPNGELEPAGYGIEFVGGSRAELDALGRFLKAIAPRATTTARPVHAPTTAPTR